jgi:hypothetical protein
MGGSAIFSDDSTDIAVPGVMDELLDIVRLDPHVYIPLERIDDVD